MHICTQENIVHLIRISAHFQIISMRSEMFVLFLSLHRDLKHTHTTNLASEVFSLRLLHNLV